MDETEMVSNRDLGSMSAEDFEEGFL